MNTELARLEPVAKMLAATGLSQSLSFCMERKYLENISIKGRSLFELDAVPSMLKEEASWIEITQVGKPIENSSENCFTAIQKILYSCFLPKETQLLFLIVGDGIENRMFLGVRSVSENVRSKSVVKSLNEFIKGVWPGLETRVTNESDDVLAQFKQDVAKEKFEHIYALTGIPSMESQYKSIYPATIDKLMAGMSKSKNYAYLVVADPVEVLDTENMLYQCREMNGQAESLKSMNVTDGLSKGYTDTISHTFTTNESTTHSESTAKKDFSKLGKAALGATGLGVAASFFPAAQSIIDASANVVGGVAVDAVSMVGAAYGFGMIGSALTNMMPQNTVSDSTTKGTSNSDTKSHGTSETNSKSISANVVNKHIEAVADKLFYHTQRLDTGKAIGLWKVGVYLMAEKKNDIQGGALQLRSILSGQESIYEPIRIHDISSILDREDGNRTIRENSLARLSSPSLMINGKNHRRFEHPLGNHYKELKSVLTTKELSYLINFPLRSVPGISVIESSPDFSLNNKAKHKDNTMSFGKLLYGGSETKIEYDLPLSVLSRHTLISGINGSGKTNTVQAILNKLIDCPFLVIEPAKTEYVDWAIEYNRTHPNEQIDIYIPGCKTYKGGFKLKDLKLNPFEIVWLNSEQEPNVLTHIDRVKSIFAAAFPMYDILPVLMEDLIYTVYQNKTSDWLNGTPIFGKTLSPTLNSMSMSVDQVIEHRQYEDKVQRNMKACLNTRIDSLKRGWKGQMLNTLKSTSWKELFDKPCVINLSYVGDDTDKSFIMALLLQFLYEYRTALAEIGKVDFNSGTCEHLTIIEEAHRVMSKCENQELPQYKSAMMFSNMLSEIRAYGEGLCIVDQVPTRLIPDAIKNTNLKIAHRLVAEDDCKAIGESMGLTEEQRKVIAKLTVGQCIVSSSLSTDTYWIKANKVK